MRKKWKSILCFIMMPACLVSCGTPEAAESGKSEVPQELERQADEGAVSEEILDAAESSVPQTDDLSGVVRETAVNSSGEEEEFKVNAAVPEEYVIPEFPLTFQNPELPTGCEITAMTMVLNYYGYEVDKMTMATRYLPCALPEFYYGSDGRLYGIDLNNYFIGDPASATGYICGTGAVLTAANTYLEENGSSLLALDISGTQPEELYRMVSENVPVVVWVTIGMEDRREAEGWYTESGEYVDWSTNDHGSVLIGYSESTVTIADPISGLMEYSREAFEQVFASRGNQCVILEE